MNIQYTPNREDILAYKIKNDVIYVNFRDVIYKYDFSIFTDGKMIQHDSRIIFNAHKENDILNVTLIMPVDKDGNEIPQDDFSIDEYEDVEIIWKPQEEIEEEKLLESLIPTKEEMENAEFEINVINLLQDLEVI